MKRLTYPGTFNLELLTEEIQASVPALFPPDPNPPAWAPGALRALCTIEGDATGAAITVPDDVPRAALDAVVSAHVPDRDGAGRRESKRVASLRASARGKLEALGLTLAEIAAIIRSE